MSQDDILVVNVCAKFDPDTTYRSIQS